TIQFIRYAALVAGRGGRVLLMCQPGLKRLLKGVAGISAIAIDAEQQFDTHCPLMELGRIFNTRLDSIPAQIPYLWADSELSQAWASRFTKTSAADKPAHGRPLRVGLS